MVTAFVKEQILSAKADIASEQLNHSAAMEEVSLVREELTDMLGTLQSEMAVLVARSPADAATFSRLRQLMYDAEEDGSFSYTRAFVEKVCRGAGAEGELFRFNEMLEGKKKHNVHKDQEITSAKLRKNLSRERRVVAAFLFSISATSERMTIMREPLDKISDHSTETQRVASGLGTGMSVSSNQRRKKHMKKVYVERFDVELAHQCGWGSKQVWAVIIWDDDFTRFWTHLVFGSAGKRQHVKQWTVIAVKTQEKIPAPRTHPTIPHRNPDFLSVPETVASVTGQIKFGESFLDWSITEVPAIIGDQVGFVLVYCSNFDIQ
jgi:hypothetical protein